jgi:hypothetical protein
MTSYMNDKMAHGQKSDVGGVDMSSYFNLPAVTKEPEQKKLKIEQPVGKTPGHRPPPVVALTPYLTLFPFISLALSLSFFRFRPQQATGDGRQPLLQLL